MKILLVDDHKSARRLLANHLSKMKDVELFEAASLDEARRALAQHDPEVALIDVRLSDDARNRDGLTLVQEMAAAQRGLPICVTATSEMPLIRQAIRAGAYDYILKDDLCEELIVPVIEGLRSRRMLEHEVSRLRARVATDVPIGGLLGSSTAMERLRDVVRRVALSDRPALVTGPTGAGKEVVVRALHTLGPNPDAPLLDVNCGSFAENLIESELFGHEKNAFTGADQKKPGYFAAVGRGTLFLDEIAELPMALQTRLLRVLESGRFRAVGANAPEQRFEGRVVAATHADLAARVKEQRFREDLYFRLNVLTVRVPPLDERREDIPALLAHFLRQQRRALTFTSEAVELLVQQRWPGNVRQLRSLVERTAVMADEDVVTPAVLSRMTDTELVSAHDQLRGAARMVLALPITGSRLQAMEDALIEEAMAASDGNKTAAARRLNVNRKSVERRVNGDDGGALGEGG